MAHKAFFSFHYEPDNWRASKVRQMGAIEGNQPVASNAWETVKSGGEAGIKRWINDQMKGKSVVIVLVGAATAGRKWIDYEIQKGWEDGRGVVGIHIHKLTDRNNRQSRKGDNPFAKFNVSKKKLSSIVSCYDPPGGTSLAVYGHIKRNIEYWVEQAIATRGQYA